MAGSIRCYGTALQKEQQAIYATVELPDRVWTQVELTVKADIF